MRTRRQVARPEVRIAEAVIHAPAVAAGPPVPEQPDQAVPVVSLQGFNCQFAGEDIPGIGS